MNNKEFGQQLEKRTLEFAIDIIKTSAELPNSIEANVIRNQITKSGTSVGANYREANRSRSKADFLNKIKICGGEASETSFWLEIIEAMNWSSNEKVKPLTKESNELTALFTSIAYNTKNKPL